MADEKESPEKTKRCLVEWGQHEVKVVSEFLVLFNGKQDMTPEFIQKLWVGCFGQDKYDQMKADNTLPSDSEAIRITQWKIDNCVLELKRISAHGKHLKALLKRQEEEIEAMKVKNHRDENNDGGNGGLDGTGMVY